MVSMRVPPASRRKNGRSQVLSGEVERISDNGHRSPRMRLVAGQFVSRAGPIMTIVVVQYGGGNEGSADSYARDREGGQWPLPQGFQSGPGSQQPWQAQWQIARLGACRQSQRQGREPE